MSNRQGKCTSKASILLIVNASTPKWRKNSCDSMLIRVCTYRYSLIKRKSVRLQKYPAGKAKGQGQTLFKWGLLRENRLW